MTTQTTELSRDLLSTIRVSKIFQDSDGPITSLSFNDSGITCLTTAEDDSLRVYDALEGSSKATVFSKKYGATLARFSHHDNNVIYASTKEDDTLRYLSLFDNKFIRYFRGHKKRVTTIDVSPIDDRVLTASLDETVRLWDLRSSTGQGVVHGQGRMVAAIDPQGLVFAVGTNTNIIHMYDIGEYTRGPFSSWSIEDPIYPSTPIPEWTSIKFTANGKYIIVTTVGDNMYVVDSFNGRIMHRLIGNAGPNDASTNGEEVSLTPDGRFVMAGGSDGRVRVWDLLQNDKIDIEPFLSLSSPHKDPIKAAEFSPSHAMFITASDGLAMWLPVSQPQ